MIWLIIFLVLLPLISWLLQYKYSKEKGDLKKFKAYMSIYYFDWLFIPFNLLWIYSISVNKILFTTSIVSSLIITILIHKFWLNLHIREKRPMYMYNLKNRKITKAGIVHFIFHFIQLTLVLIFLLSNNNSLQSYLSLLILSLFFLSTIPGSRKTHGQVKETDSLFLILGILIIILKLIYMLI